MFGAKYALEHNWSVNAYTMGHGKTLIAIILSLFTKSKTLVICPAFLKINWHREFERFSKRKLNIKVLYSPELKTFKPSNEDVIIINYDIIKNALYLFEWGDFVVCDESHYLGSPSSQRTKAVFYSCVKYKPNRILFLSGSPIRGRVSQWYIPIKLMGSNPAKNSGEHWPHKYVAFQDTFCHYRMVQVGSRMFKKYYGLKNEGSLRRLLKDKFLRKCPDFELELPDLMFEDIEVDYAVDDKELQELFLEYEQSKKMSDHLSSAKKSNALSKVPFTFKFTKNIIEAGEGPLVIYSDHVVPLDDLSKLLNKAKISNTIINGGTSLDKRQEYIDAFQGGSTDVFLATIGAASTGITLTRSNKLIFNDKSWINTENGQALKRIHRISQDRHCIIYSILSGKVDKMIYKIIKEKDLVMQKTADFSNL